MSNITDTDDGHGVKGWLLLLCLILTIISPAAHLGQLEMEWQEFNSLFGTYPHLRDAVVIETLLTLGLMAYSIYAGFVLWSFKFGAVKIAKSYLLAWLICSIARPFIFVSIADLPTAFIDEILDEGGKNVVISILTFAIWFTYLYRSKRVRATYQPR
jgi:hypothetical protein